MSTAQRKARKRAGVRFERTPKSPTPVAERAVNVERREQRVRALLAPIISSVAASLIHGGLR